MEFLMTYGPLIILTIVWIAVLIIPQRKRNEERRRLLSSVEVNDEIMTSGGIIGKVIKIDENVIVVESGPDRARLRMTKDSVVVNYTKEKLAQESKSTKK